jgi:hypothetical protein
MCERDLRGVSVVGNGQPGDVGRLKGVHFWPITRPVSAERRGFSRNKGGMALWQGWVEGSRHPSWSPFDPIKSLKIGKISRFRSLSPKTVVF